MRSIHPLLRRAGVMALAAAGLASAAPDVADAQSRTRPSTGRAQARPPQEHPADARSSQQRPQTRAAGNPLAR
ncbi:MAG TPA: hypothetical protein VF142_10855, partial [Longimicrobium sp.]